MQLRECLGGAAVIGGEPVDDHDDRGHDERIRHERELVDLLVHGRECLGEQRAADDRSRQPEADGEPGGPGVEADADEQQQRAGDADPRDRDYHHDDGDDADEGADQLRRELGVARRHRVDDDEGGHVADRDQAQREALARR